MAMEIVFAAETLVPPAGGAERFWLELAAGLAERHRVRALAFGDPGDETEIPRGVEWIALDPPATGSAWTARAARRDALAAALTRELSRRPADVVAGQLHAGPAAVAAARATGAAGMLFIPGYEALCHWSFGASSQCVPPSRCRECPRVLALDPIEREAKWAERSAQDEALGTATALVAPSRAMADAVERACGRRPHVIPPVTSSPPAARADPAGHLAAVASFWTRDKGVELLAPIAGLVSERRLVVQLPPTGIPEQVAAALQALPNVTLRQPPGEIGDVLDGAAMLLVPSQLDEPFGRVAFEGLASGVPTLASDAGGLRETVPPGQLVSPRDDAHAWATAIRLHLRPAEWAAARDRGTAAAEAVLAYAPLERAERVMGTVAPSRSSSMMASI